MFLHQKINHFQIFAKFKDNLSENSPEEIEKWRAERRARFPKIANNDHNNQSSNTDETKINQDRENIIKNQGFKANYSNNKFKRKFHQHSNKSKYHGNKRFSPHNKYQTNNASKRPQTKNHSPNTKCQNEPKSIKTEESPKKNPAISSNSLNMLACYSSDESSDLEQNSPTKQNSIENDKKIITDLLNELIIKVDKKITAEKNVNANMAKKRLKKRPPCPPLPSYNQLTLFQKLMLQDIRKIKDELLYCIKYMVETNYLKNT